MNQVPGKLFLGQWPNITKIYQIEQVQDKKDIYQYHSTVYIPYIYVWSMHSVKGVIRIRTDNTMVSLASNIDPSLMSVYKIMYQFWLTVYIWFVRR
jgi:hypothetical protein